MREIKSQFKHSHFKRVLLAVSGGLDSICLAHFFIHYKKELDVEWIGIAHIHHGLREKTADQDSLFVEALAKENNVSFFLKKLDGNALKKSKGSLEEIARTARYNALQQFALENKADAIVTAHHAGDQAETLYLRLHRGVTLAGLRGIPIKRDNIYRPFLSLTRKDLKAYAYENKIEWREDESNFDISFARNLIRHQKLPLLEKQIEGSSAQLCHIANLASKVYDKVIAQANLFFESAVISAELWPFYPAVSPYKKVLAIDETKLSIDKKSEFFRLWLDSKGFRFPVDSFSSNFIPAKYSYRTRFIEKCRNIIWICDKSTTNAVSNLYFNTEKQKFSHSDGSWRTPQNGDMLWPLDEKIKARPLAKWLREKRIPHWIQDYLKVFAQESRVLYVSGIRLKQNKGK